MKIKAKRKYHSNQFRWVVCCGQKIGIAKKFPKDSYFGTIKCGKCGKSL